MPVIWAIRFAGLFALSGLGLNWLSKRSLAANRVLGHAGAVSPGAWRSGGPSLGLTRRLYFHLCRPFVLLIAKRRDS